MYIISKTKVMIWKYIILTLNINKPYFSPHSISYQFSAPFRVLHVLSTPKDSVFK